MIAVYIMAFFVRFYRAIYTTLRRKSGTYSEAEYLALSWFYWLQELNKDGTAARQSNCFEAAHEARMRLLRLIGDGFSPEVDKTVVAAEAPETLPQGVESLEVYRKKKMNDNDEDEWF